jgi:ubiquitin carboxyl-terminal hydrolase 9/24
MQNIDFPVLLLCRQEVIERLQSEHSVVILVTNSLTNYMDKVRQLVKENSEIDANIFMPDDRYNHILQVQERLNFLRFLLKVYFVSLE